MRGGYNVPMFLLRKPSPSLIRAGIIGLIDGTKFESVGRVNRAQK